MSLTGHVSQALNCQKQRRGDWCEAVGSSQSGQEAEEPVAESGLEPTSSPKTMAVCTSLLPAAWCLTSHRCPEPWMHCPSRQNQFSVGSASCIAGSGTHTAQREGPRPSGPGCPPVGDGSSRFGFHSWHSSNLRAFRGQAAKQDHCAERILTSSDAQISSPFTHSPS